MKNKIIGGLVALTVIAPVAVPGSAIAGAKWNQNVSARKCYKRVIHRHGAVEFRVVSCKKHRRGPRATTAKSSWS